MGDNSLHKKLDRFASAIKTPSSADTEPKIPDRYYRLCRAVGGEMVVGQAGAYCLSTTTYPLDYIHGNFVLSDFPLREPLPLSAFTALEQQGEVDISKTLFLDTETTGLGGAGAVAFLVGCGSVVKDGFEVRQYLLPDYSDEAAMLEDLLVEFGPDTTIVTYNGAAFDVPLIRDRMIINRVARQVEHEHHIDLLHCARRLFKRRLQDCRLVNVESQVFGFERVDDIPGYLIPSIYFEWLGGENLDMMPLVLQHNRLDIVSLFYLLGHVGRIHLERGEVLDSVDDLHSLSRVYARRGQPELVSEVFERLADRGGPALADDIVLFHSLNFKRSRDYLNAVPMWQALSESSSREAYWANIELAKYYEHFEQKPELAYRYTRRAQKICPYTGSRQIQLTKRLTRLAAKLKK
ncbi:MAG: ribonuclease H-like domain-containing protein [Candidatus Zixiibacteriota bacterium]